MVHKVLNRFCWGPSNGHLPYRMWGSMFEEDPPLKGRRCESGIQTLITFDMTGWNTGYFRYICFIQKHPLKISMEPQNNPIEKVVVLGFIYFISIVPASSEPLVVQVPMFSGENASTLGSLLKKPANQSKNPTRSFDVRLGLLGSMVIGSMSYYNPNIFHLSVGEIPSRELTYPLPRHFWRWFSFSHCGIC